MSGRCHQGQQIGRLRKFASFREIISRIFSNRFQRNQEVVLKKRLFVKGNEAVAMGAIEAGCRYYFGYPITPQNDIPEYMSREMPRVGGCFIQAESEVAAINMVLGAGAAGGRVMTSSSGPGISLKAEGISFMAGSEVPAVIVNIQRPGPGLGGIDVSQADYFQAVKGAGHGGYHLVVLAPHSVQELYDLTMLAFDLADRYRMPALVLGDAMLGQMKEALMPHPYQAPEDLPRKDWAVTGKHGRAKGNAVKSLYLGDGELEAHNWHLHAKYARLRENEVRYEATGLDDAELILTAFGGGARIVKTAIAMARREGLKVGLIRPVTVYPFPAEIYRKATERTPKVLCVELNNGQMVEDVRLSSAPGADVRFYGRPGGTGSLPNPEEIFEQICKHYKD
jgi:2-oxoglutarate ferredoxin oxidoreductase subunit alpha